MRHTPGPWKCEKLGTTDMWIVYDNPPRGVFISAICRTYSKSTKYSDGNAHLIAAAPDLLAVCKWVLGCLNNMPKDFDNLSARKELIEIIEKAEGK